MREVTLTYGRFTGLQTPSQQLLGGVQWQRDIATTRGSTAR